MSESVESVKRIALFLREAAQKNGNPASKDKLNKHFAPSPRAYVTYNMGSVNSIGNVIYQAGDRRLCAQTSSFMFHGIGFDINNARMELKQLKEKVSGIANDQTMISGIMVRHTGLGSDDVDMLFLDMAFMSAQEFLNCGITDEVRDIHLPHGLPIQQLVFQG